MTSKVEGVEQAECQKTPEWITGIPNETPHLIVFDDQDCKQLMFAGHGARQAALKAWGEVSQQWNAHLFVRVEKNSRDAMYPCATLAQQKSSAEWTDDAIRRAANLPFSEDGYVDLGILSERQFARLIRRVASALASEKATLPTT